VGIAHWQSAFALTIAVGGYSLRLGAGTGAEVHYFYLHAANVRVLACAYACAFFCHCPLVHPIPAALLLCCSVILARFGPSKNPPLSRPPLSLALFFIRLFVGLLLSHHSTITQHRIKNQLLIFCAYSLCRGLLASA
jgi:hypothetical protein